MPQDTRQRGAADGPARRALRDAKTTVPKKMRRARACTPQRHAHGRAPVFVGMNLLILGATGKTGREIVDLALHAGHRVIAYVRSPHKIQRCDPRLVVHAGAVLDVNALAAALSGQDAVLSALGLPPRQALRPNTFMAESAATTVAAMQRAGVPRLVILSAAVLFPGSGLQYTFFRWLLQHHARDLTAMEAVVKATDLQWTIARPPRLVQTRDTTHRCRIAALPDGSLSVSFRAVASYMLAAAERRLHLGQVVGVTR
jgi:putative NADH-flavin reductase